MIGGRNGTEIASVEAYSPSRDSITAVTPLAVARHAMATAVAPDGRVTASNFAASAPVAIQIDTIVVGTALT